MTPPASRDAVARAVLALVLTATLAIGVAGIPGVAAQSSVEQADLDVTQPEYVEDGVETSETDAGARIYRVTGPRHLISVQNVNRDNITGFGVADGSGKLSRHDSLDAYVYRPNGNGTATLYWTVRETRGHGNNSTTVTQRYEAVIQTTATTWVHRTSGEDDALQEKASKFDEIEDEVDRLAPDEDTDSVISSALTYYRFFDSPFSTLVADMRGVLFLMILRPGGWIITGVFLLISLLGVAGGARYKNRTQKQFGDIGDIQIEKTEAYLEQAKRILSNCDYNEFLPDDAARAMRDTLGRNPWIGFKNYLLLRSPTHVKGLVLQMMSEIGYEGRYRRAPDGSIKDAWVVRPDHDADGRDTMVADGSGTPDNGDVDDAVETMLLDDLAYENDEHRAFIDAISGDELDLAVFHADHIGPDDVSFPISNREVDDAELLEELNPDFPDDFEDEEHLARVLGKTVEFVVNHDHTDEWGRPRRGMDLLAFLSEMDSVLADEADFPLGPVQRRELVYVAENMEKQAEMTETVDRLQNEGAE